MKKIPLSYYRQADVVLLAKDLIGKILHTNINNQPTSGIITETEAYRGADDKACHAYLGKKTKRNQIMLENGGYAYVYLCYGIHYLFNIVTNIKNNPDAVLVRAIQPITGIETMLRRRNKTQNTPKIACGPGNVSQALGIIKQHNGLLLNSDTIWLTAHAKNIDSSLIKSTKRIGIANSEEAVNFPWRFVLKD